MSDLAVSPESDMLFDFLSGGSGSAVEFESLVSGSTLPAFLDFLVRPVGVALHEGCGGLGQRALALQGSLSAYGLAPYIRSIPYHTPHSHSPLTDASEAVAVLEESVARQDARRAAGGHAPSSPPGSDLCAELAGGIVSAQAASFASYVEELQNSVGEELAAGAGSSSSSSSAPPLSPASTGSARTLRLRSASGLSILSPRTDEEVVALRQLARRLHTQELNLAFAPPGAAVPLAPLDAAVAAPATAEGSSPVAGAAAAAPPLTSHSAAQAAELECQAFERSYRVMRLLVGGTAHADELLATRGEEVVRRAFDVFSSRSRGSPLHAAALLQRCLQLCPDTLVAALLPDSQRYIGSLLPFLHVPAVADALVQIVTLTHTASAGGGAGPSATLGPLGGARGESLSQGSAAGGSGFLSGLRGNSLLGGFGGGWGGQQQGTPASRMLAHATPAPAVPSSTAFSGPLGFYAQKGNAPLPAALATLHRSLTGWGFLAVLAAHVYRAEFSPARQHATGAADALTHILRAAAHDDRYDSLLQPLATCPALLSGLCAAASGCAAGLSGGVDYDPSQGYCGAGGGVPHRQAEAMRVLRVLTALAFTDSVYAGGEAGSALAAATSAAIASGAGVPAAGMPRMVPCRLAPYAGVLARALIAALPRLGGALVGMHRAMHPGVQLGAGGEGTGGKARKKKVKKAAGKKRLSVDSSSTGGVGGGSGGGKEEEGEEEDSSHLPTAAAAAAAPNSPADSSHESHSAANSALSQTPASSASAFALPGVYATPAKGGSTASPSSAPYFPHPGHAYAAQFGSYRVAAVEVIAALLSRDALLGHVESLPAAGPSSNSSSSQGAEPSALHTPEASAGEAAAPGAEGSALALAVPPSPAAAAAGPHGEQGHALEGSGSPTPHSQDSGAVGKAVRSASKAAAQAVGVAMRSLMGLGGKRPSSGSLTLGSSADEEEGGGGEASFASPWQPQEKCSLAALEALCAPAYLGGAGAAGPTFSPAEFWAVLTHWVLLYPHTNMYHNGFVAIVRGALRCRHEAALVLLLRHAKLLSCFLQHYTHTAPAAAATASPSSSSGGASAPRFPCSSARGHLLRVFNMLRISVPAFPPTSFLPSYLRDHEQWVGFQPRLKEDSLAHFAMASREGGGGYSLPGGRRLGPGGMGGGGSGAGSGTLAALQQIFSGQPNALASLLGGGGGSSGRRKGGEEEWGGIGSPLARELGLEGLVKYDGVVAAATAAAAAAAAAAASPGAAAGSAGKKGAASASPSPLPPAAAAQGAGAGARKAGVRERAASKGTSSEVGSGGHLTDDEGVARRAAAGEPFSGGTGAEKGAVAHGSGSGSGKGVSAAAAVTQLPQSVSSPSKKGDTFFLSDSSGLLGLD